MDYKEEIGYRDKILSRVRDGERITSEERLWLATNRIINRTLGYPYLHSDIIHLQPKVNYLIRIKVENLTYPNRIIPIITVPGGKGKIVTDTLITDYNGKVSSTQNVKMLGLLINLNHNETELLYQSALGVLGVSYECDYFDTKQHIMIRKNSCVGDPNFAMIGESLADNKVLYRCKAPTDNSFESLVFSIEWVTPKG